MVTFFVDTSARAQELTVLFRTQEARSFAQ